MIIGLTVDGGFDRGCCVSGTRGVVVDCKYIFNPSKSETAGELLLIRFFPLLMEPFQVYNINRFMTTYAKLRYSGINDIREQDDKSYSGNLTDHFEKQHILTNKLFFS